MGEFPRVGSSPTARTMEIRNLRLEDLDRVLEISQKSLPQPWPRSEFEKYIEGAFVAEENGKIIGFIIGKISEDIGQIKLIAVDPSYQEKGIGRKLVEHLLNYLKENRARRVLARSRTKNKAGINFLKNSGFKIIETIEKYYPNGENAYLMKKEL